MFVSSLDSFGKRQIKVHFRSVAKVAFIFECPFDIQILNGIYPKGAQRAVFLVGLKFTSG